jgi:hypothetical protein
MPARNGARCHRTLDGRARRLNDRGASRTPADLASDSAAVALSPVAVLISDKGGHQIRATDVARMVHLGRPAARVIDQVDQPAARLGDCCFALARAIALAGAFAWKHRRRPGRRQRARSLCVRRCELVDRARRAAELRHDCDSLLRRRPRRCSRGQAATVERLRSVADHVGHCDADHEPDPDALTPASRRRALTGS